MRHRILLTPAELQSSFDRTDWAESLIKQLPKNHDGRNSWLINYGLSSEANRLRRVHSNRTNKILQYWSDFKAYIYNGPLI